DALGCEQVTRSVNMRLERNAFFPDFAYLGERVNLVAAAVGEQRFIPSVKFMQSPGFLDNVESGTQVEVIGVAQNDLCLDIVSKFGLVDRLHRAGSSHRHKNRGLDIAMVGLNFS